MVVRVTCPDKLDQGKVHPKQSLNVLLKKMLSHNKKKRKEILMPNY